MEGNHKGGETKDDHNQIGQDDLKATAPLIKNLYSLNQYFAYIHKIVDLNDDQDLREQLDDVEYNIIANYFIKLLKSLN